MALSRPRILRMAASTIYGNLSPFRMPGQKGLATATVPRPPQTNNAPTFYNFSPSMPGIRSTPAGLLNGEKSAKDLLADLEKHRTPQTAVISWPSVYVNDLAEYQKQLLEQPPRGDELLMVTRALEQNTSLRTLMLLNRLEEIRWFEPPTLYHAWGGYGEYYENTREARVYNGVYRPRLNEMIAIVQGLVKNKSVKVLWITNWCKGGSYEWFSCGAYEGWREMIDSLADTLKINTTLEIIDLRMTTVPLGCHEDEVDYIFDDERDDSLVELSSGELMPTSIEGEYPYVPGNPTSEGGPWHRREDEPFSSHFFWEYGSYGTDWSQTDYYCQEISTFAPLTLGKAIRDRALKGITTTLKGVPLSRAWKELGLPKPRPSWECSGPDSDSGDKAVNRESGNEAIITKWLEEGRARHAQAAG